MPTAARNDLNAEQKQKDKAKAKGGGGELGALGFTKSGMRPQNTDIRSLTDDAAADITSPDMAKRGTYKPTKVPTHNPLKYTKNIVSPTQEYQATPQNLGTLLAKVVGHLAMPGPLGLMSPMVEDELGLGFTNPTGTVDNFSYDATQKNNAQTGAVQSTMGAEQPQQKKKKKVPPPGFTLLENAGGTLLGN